MSPPSPLSSTPFSSTLSLSLSQVPVGHLVFMVHGIGQRMESADLVDDVTAFRRNAAAAAEVCLTPYQRYQQRCLFIPCQVGMGTE